MPLRRSAGARAADDAFIVVITSGRISEPKLAVLPTDKQGPSLIDLGKEGDNSSSLRLEISPHSRTFSPRKEKIEALKGLGIRSSIGRARNL